jgi:hypothetical protein
MTAEQLAAVLAKPLPEAEGMVHSGGFDPWEDVIEGISGSYSSESDTLMIDALEAVRDRSTLPFISKRGFVGEFALYVLAGHGLTDYGSSPRGSWPSDGLEPLWQPLIDKWKAYSAIVWSKERG